MSKAEHIFLIVGASWGIISGAFDLWFIWGSWQQRRKFKQMQKKYNEDRERE